MTVERAAAVLSLVREGVLFAITLAREVSREMVRRVRAGRVVIRDERRSESGTIHGR